MLIKTWLCLGGERRSSRRRSRRARLCAGGAACRALPHSDTEIPIALQPRKVTAWRSLEIDWPLNYDSF